VRHIVITVTRTLALYSFAAWAYVAMIAVFYPPALRIQLTHFTKQPHTDTFGEVNFVISLVSYFVYRLLADAPRRQGAPRHQEDAD
jgi:hypothetical protein